METHIVVSLREYLALSLLNYGLVTRDWGLCVCVFPPPSLSVMIELKNVKVRIAVPDYRKIFKNGRS